MVQEALYLREVTQEIPNCVSPTAACRALTISRSTLDRLCAQGRLEKIRVSDGRVGITIESIARHLAALNGSPETVAAPEPRISRRKRELQARSAARRAQRVRSAA
jgi:predicted site-specific integrase-resolvase